MKALHACIAAIALLAPPAMAGEVGPVPDAVRESFKLAPFYQKYLDAGGMPIVGSAKVSDAALAECAWIVGHMLKNRPDILKALGEAKVRFTVMAWNEFTTDVPEHADLTPAGYWDRRARGLGPSPDRPSVSGGEENLLAYPGDPYPTEIIPIHEFAHAIHLMALDRLDPTFDGRLQETYRKALDAGLWKNTYAAENKEEYWAEGVQSWFDNNRENDAIHNHVNTRAELTEYDPGLAALLREVFGENDWHYVKPADRDAAGRAHLAGMPENPPRFEWRKDTERYDGMADPPEDDAEAGSPCEEKE